MSQGAFVERAEDWAAIRGEALVEARRAAHGAEFVFRNEPAVRARLEELVALEHQCCGPGGIEWQLRDAGDLVVVSVEASAEAAGSESAATIYEWFARQTD